MKNMKYDIIRPIAMTVIAIGSLKNAEDRTELLNGNLWLWFILIVFIASWVGFFVRKSKENKK
ncbi:hypothetical protein [Polaribacter sp. R77954]|uniref:hypothetical protein n=1 Tax=Polaribacter sp. R77954 TaxID=3093870 RepID=UPI0037C998F2